MAGVVKRATHRTHTPQRQHPEQLWSGLDSSPSSILLHSHSSNTHKKKKSFVPGENEVIRALWEGQEVLEAELGHEQDGEYVRPEILEDLLPHDFSKWNSTTNGSILPATGSLPGRRSSNVGGRLAQRAFCRPRLCEGSDSFLGGEDGEKLVGHSREFTGAGSLVMEDWSGLVGGGGVGVGGGGGIDRTIYQNLVEMLPLMESFMEQKGGNRRPFTRHASMVYTPAPSRDTPLKKVAESPLKSKKNKQQRPANGNAKPADETPQWDEQENMLRRIEKDDCVQQQHSEAQAMIERLSREELTELQNQIDGLKQQLWEKDNMLKTVRSYEIAENAKQEQILELKARLEEFHTALQDKDRITEMIQSQLTEKQRQLGTLESVLERTQLEMIRKNDAATRMQEELSQLRIQASKFQFQSELQSGRILLEEQEGDEVETADDDNYAEIRAELQMESESMEAARRLYLGAVITAKNKPGVESMVLAAESRKMLQRFLFHPMPLC